MSPLSAAILEKSMDITFTPCALHGISPVGLIIGTLGSVDLMTDGHLGPG